MSRSSALDTPMMRQYLAIKARHPDAIVFYRMGDFYEMFLEDAERVAPILDIALTTRDRNKPDPVPMCGVPVHAASQHIQKLASLGYRVAICEQVEDPAESGRRLVRREVVEVVTPGLAGDPEALDAARPLHLVALAPAEPQAGLAAVDATTGELRATVAPWEPLFEEILRLGPREILLPGPAAARGAPGALRTRLLRELPEAVVTEVPPEDFAGEGPGGAPALESLEGDDPAARAARAVVRYLERHQPFALRHLAPLRRYALADTMVLDASTRAHLELFENAEDRGRRQTLIERLDRTRTPMGARQLARLVAYPLLRPEAIRARQEAVAWLAERDRLRGRLREALGGVRDLARRLSAVARPGAAPRDLARLRDSLRALPAVAAALAPEAEPGELPSLSAEPPASLPRPRPLEEPLALLEAALVEDPPALPRGSRGAEETGFIRAGFHTDLDALRESAAKGREWIAGLEARERERTGIRTLKIRYHPVHGYALEVGRAHLSRVPADYERKQTLAQAERFTTAALREMEQQVLGARSRAAALERRLLEELRAGVLAHAPAVREVAAAVAELDALQSLAEVARQGGWVRPEIDDGVGLCIRGGRHPVVEQAAAGRGEEFVPNDTALGDDAAAILVITGPNMAGKSTYLRQVALIALLAQMGSFVPAESARVGVVDRIFTRVGATDRLARGESTFMVEMRETAEILAQATPRSLLVLDEIGRGTSTFDGLSIAWAVIEFLHDAQGGPPRTLFATHYHELVELGDRLDGVDNAHFAAREAEDGVVFLRRLLPGGASHSYGIQVARLAGLPAEVIRRAQEVLRRLEAGEVGPAPAPATAPGRQLGLFEAPSAAEREVLEELRRMVPEETTPLEALRRLAALRDRLLSGGAS